jgi:hypothetical protein
MRDRRTIHAGALLAAGAFFAKGCVFARVEAVDLREDFGLRGIECVSATHQFVVACLH